MGFFSKLKFWKKDDDFDFDNIVSKDQIPPDDLGLNPPTGLEEKSAFDNPELQPAPEEVPKSGFEEAKTMSQPLNDLDLVNSKLDTIKALLTSLDQRMANIERTSQPEKQKLW